MTAIVAAVEIRHDTGRVAYAAHVVTDDRRVVCPHANGHRTLEAAFRCGERMKRGLPAA